MGKVPADPNYTIGSCRSSEDWYYAQTKSGNGNINFDLDKTYNKYANLKISIAAASSAGRIS